MLIQIVRKVLISEIVALIQPVPEDRTLQALCFFLESTAPVGRYIDVEDTDNDEGHLLIQLGHIGF